MMTRALSVASLGTPLGGGGLVTLPRYLLDDLGTELEGFENVPDWTPAGGSIAANNVEFRTGTQSIKASINIGASFSMQKVVSWDFGGNAPRLRFYVYLHNTVDEYERFRFYVSSVANLATHFWYNQVATGIGLKQGWNAIDINPDQWLNVGGESWSSTMVKCQVYTRASAGNTPDISYDTIVRDQVGVPVVMVTFDDADGSVYSEAYDYMHRYNVHGTFYVGTAAVGGGGQVTSAQLQEMDGDGWSIGNHTQNQVDLTTLTEAQAEAELQAAETDLNGWGLTGASRHVAYVGGAWNETVLKAMGDTSMLTGRATFENAFPMPTENRDMDLTIGTINVPMATSLATVKGYVDDAISYRRVLSLLFHKIVAVPALATEWAIDDFHALIDYLREKQVPCITINDFYDSADGPIRVPRIW